MPVNYRIDAGRRMICTTCSGNLTLAEVVEHFQTLSEDPDCVGTLDVHLDLTETRTVPQVHEIQSVGYAMSMIRIKARFGACAIIAPNDALFGMMRMFEVFAGEHFRVIRVFRGSTEASAWLVTQQLPIDHET
jgi:hypothetical protein